MRKFGHCLLFVLFCTCLSFCWSQVLPPEEVQALQDLKQAIPELFPSIEINSGSCSPPVPGLWCILENGFYHIQQIINSSRALEGTIPNSIVNLKHLDYIDLSDNRLSGPIPPILGEMAPLYTLYLHDNQFTGTIPDTFGKLSLRMLHLQRNRLTGTLPLSLGNITTLYEIRVNENDLSGTIPDIFGDMEQLEFLELNNNHFTGLIPNSIEKLSDSLRILQLNDNELTGDIPEFLNTMRVLLTCNLADNDWNCPINISFPCIDSLNQACSSSNENFFQRIMDFLRNNGKMGWGFCLLCVFFLLFIAVVVVVIIIIILVMTTTFVLSKRKSNNDLENNPESPLLGNESG